MIAKAFRWARHAWPWWRRYGIRAGTRCARAAAHAGWQATPGSLVPIRVPDHAAPLLVRAQTSDTFVLRQLVAEGELDFPLPFEPRRIVDGGANIGLASRVFRARWPAATIVAIELDSANAALAARNLDGADVRLIHAGLWCEDRPLRIANPDAEPCALQAEPATEPAAAIPGLTMQTLLATLDWAEADLVKLDIEGAEVEVLATAAEWLPRVRCLAIELHERFRPGCEAALAAAIAGGGWSRQRHGEYDILTREPA